MKKDDRNRMIDAVAVVITTVWVLSAIVSMLDRTYSIHSSIVAALGAALGYLFGHRIWSSKKPPTPGGSTDDSNPGD